MKKSLNKRAFATLLAFVMVVEGMSATQVSAAPMPQTQMTEAQIPAENVASTGTMEFKNALTGQTEDIADIELESIMSVEEISYLSEGDSYETAYELEFNQERKVSLEGFKSVYFKFIPKTDAEYTFYVNSTIWAYATLEDAAHQKLESENGSGLFTIICDLESSKTYYLRIVSDEDIDEDEEPLNGTCHICVNKTPFHLFDSSYTIKYGEEQSISVTATPENEMLTYQWYRYDETKETYTIIDGATERSYLVKADRAVASSYQCVVTDGETTRTATIAVTVDTINLKDETATKFVYADYGKTAMFQVEAESLTGKTLTYQWYDSTDTTPENLINGAMESSYTVTANDNAVGDSARHYYSCVVSDGSTTKTKKFELSVKTIDHSLISRSPVSYGRMVTLHVVAESLRGRELTYQWYNADTYADIIGATESSYTVIADENTPHRIGCRIREADASFSSTTSSPITIQSLIVTGQTSYYAKTGEQVTLHAKTQSLLPNSNLTYEWYDTENGDKLEGADSADYTVTAGDTAQTYYCKVSDGFETKTIPIYLKIESSNDKKVESIAIGDKYQTLFISELDNFTQPIKYPIKVNYTDGTQDTAIPDDCWLDISLNENKEWPSGEQKGYISYHGVTTSYDIYVVKFSEVGQTIHTGQTVFGQAGITEAEYDYYCVELPKAGQYKIQIKGLAGEGNGILLFYTHFSLSPYFNTQFPSNCEITCSYKNTVYFGVKSANETPFSYEVVVDTVQNLAEPISENGSIAPSGYYKFTPEQSGLYQIAGTDSDADKTMCVIYNEQLDSLCNMTNNKTQYYLTKGTVYYIASQDNYPGGTLRLMQAVEYPAGTKAGAEGTISWLLDTDRLLTIEGEGEMPDNFFPWQYPQLTSFYSDKHQSVKKAIIGNGITEIGRFTFYREIDLEEVQLPDSIRKINSYSFSYCTALAKIDIPEGLLDMGTGVFYNCTALEKVTLPTTLTGMGANVFFGCKKLSDIRFPETSSLSYIGFHAFSGTAWLDSQKDDYVVHNGILIHYQRNGATELLPDSVKVIGPSSYISNFQNLRRISLHDNLTRIDELAFSNCKNLESITIPGSVTNIAYCAFFNCTALENVVLAEGVKSIGKGTFLNCENLSSITIPKSVTEIGDYAIGYQGEMPITGAFYTTGKSDTLPTIYCYQNSAAHKYALENEITYRLLDSETSSSESSETTDSENVSSDSEKPAPDSEAPPSGSEHSPDDSEAPPSGSEHSPDNSERVPSDSETHISDGEGTPTDSGTYPSSGQKKDLSNRLKCQIILSVTESYYTQQEITPGVTVCYDSRILQQGVDYQVSYENNINIGTGIISIHGIGNYTGNISVTFAIKAKTGASYTIGNYQYKIIDDAQVAFKGMKNSNAKTVKIPKTVAIGGQAFKITSIADKALYKKKITSVTIGANVQMIGKSAFESCTGLKKVEMGKNVKAIGDRAFYKCSKLTAITFPSKVSQIGRQAFYNCKKLSDITIKTKKLTTSNIGSKAFKGIYKKAVIKVPKKKLKAYQTLLRSKGIGTKAKFTV